MNQLTGSLELSETLSNLLHRSQWTTSPWHLIGNPIQEFRIRASKMELAA